MSAYYSTLNNSDRNNNPGNFGISNTVRLSVLSNNGYTSGLNNAGLVKPVESVQVNTNVIASLTQPAHIVDNGSLLSMLNTVDDGKFSNLDVTGSNNPVNNVNNMLNNSVKFNVINANVLNSFGSGPVIGVNTGVNGVNGYN